MDYVKNDSILDFYKWLKLKNLDKHNFNIRFKLCFTKENQRMSKMYCHVHKSLCYSFFFDIDIIRPFHRLSVMINNRNVLQCKYS